MDSSIRRLLPGTARPDLIRTRSFPGIELEALFAGEVLGIPIIGACRTAIKAFEEYVAVPVGGAVEYSRLYDNHCDLAPAPSRSTFGDIGPAGIRKPFLRAGSRPKSSSISGKRLTQPSRGDGCSEMQ